MRLLLALLLLCLTTLPGRADEPFDITRTQVGQTVRWRTDNGNTAVTYLGPEARLYRLEFERDKSKGSPGRATFWANRRGELVKAQSGSFTIQYKPGDCTLTPGRCTYVESHSNGAQRKMIHLASVKDGVWSYRLYHTAEKPANMLEEGTFTVDAAGFVIDRTYRILEDGKWRNAWSKRR